MNDEKKDPEKNLLFIPPERDRAAARKCCPYCQNLDFLGNNNAGSITFTCTKCKKSWGGSLPRTPIDPLRPLPVTKYVPTSDVYVNPKTQNTEEILSRQDMRPDFKRGGLIPLPGEEDGDW